MNDKLFEFARKLINNVNNPPDVVKKRQVWRIPYLKPSIHILVMWEDGEFARVIPIMRTNEVPRDLLTKRDIIFTDSIISLRQLGAVAFPSKVQILECEIIKKLTYIGELSVDNFKVIHYADHHDYSFVDNKRFYRADIGFIFFNEKN